MPWLTNVKKKSHLKFAIWNRIPFTASYIVKTSLLAHYLLDYAPELVQTAPFLNIFLSL